MAASGPGGGLPPADAELDTWEAFLAVHSSMPPGAPVVEACQVAFAAAMGLWKARTDDGRGSVVAAKLLQMVVSSLRTKEQYAPFGSVEVLTACLGVVTADPSQEVAVKALKLLNNAVVANPEAQALLVAPCAAHVSLVACLADPAASTDFTSRLLAMLLRLLGTNDAFQMAAFITPIPTPDGGTTCTIAVLTAFLSRLLASATATPVEGGGLEMPSEEAASVLTLGKGVLQVAFALARGAESIVTAAKVDEETRAGWMGAIAALVQQLIAVLQLPTAAFPWALPLQQEAVKVLVNIPLQASMSEPEAGAEPDWSLANQVHAAGGTTALLRFVHHSLLAVLVSQPPLLAQITPPEEVAGTAAGGAVEPPLDPAFRPVTPSAAFPCLVLLHRLCSAELPVRAAAMPTVMQGSGYVAVQASTGAATAAGGSLPSAADLLYDSEIDDTSGAATVPLFVCLKAAMQVNPPQALLKRFAGELIFLGVGQHAGRYTKVLGVGLALPLLRRSGLVELQDAEGAAVEPAGAAGTGSASG